MAGQSDPGGETPPKQRLLECFARVAKAMASPQRLDILEALAQGEHSVEALAQAIGAPKANTSHHLQVLREGGLVNVRRAGVQAFYRLSDEEEIVGVLNGLRRIAEEQLAEVNRIVREAFESRDPLTPVSHDELMERAREGDVTVIDVRPDEEYRAGHIEGAVNVPLEELDDRLAELPRDREVVAYCRGPYCMLAFEAVERLRQQGYQVRRLEAGYPEWNAAHLPVARGE
ncbi:Rhodanese-related sulfurtransferase [Thiohalospira halophila DSM 15071]|uniref:Rhodanese-related sulfurtransferase n=1 Tax=Thiohalospira halophila DSM 15071 TaxID=1123397 RepID=A0A1I1U526_9GAMM|nr:metalloregulator ArsR/SmtB family transcription factor [Thiohalospira halophila]SFD65936.1 Rhodanese-related sulfurtransferase [Thiohalospira halophila DSM 15071]